VIAIVSKWVTLSALVHSRVALAGAPLRELRRKIRRQLPDIDNHCFPPSP
jgi:hypothetical protein